MLVSKISMPKIFTAQPKRTQQDVINLVQPVLDEIKKVHASNTWTHNQYETIVINGVSLQTSSPYFQFLHVNSGKKYFTIDLENRKLVFHDKPWFGAVKKAYKQAENFMSGWKKVPD